MMEHPVTAVCQEMVDYGDCKHSRSLNRKCPFWSIVGRHDWKENCCRECGLSFMLEVSINRYWKQGSVKEVTREEAYIRVSDGREIRIPVNTSLSMFLEEA